MKINHKKIEKLIEYRIIEVPRNIKRAFPKVIKKQVRWVSFAIDQVLVLIFLDSKDMQRIQEYQRKGYDLFPGFITTEQSKEVAIRLTKNARNNIFKDCDVSGMYSFLVDKDTTFIVQDHSQVIETNELGKINYRVPLAYVVSSGENALEQNVYESLDELIAYSIKVWRGKI
ncbi:MAG: hypothetical protein GY845_17240 [Planctomycetes bacterium]|nr:hypothetical protein [Planctomycetota bacterium]